jgi:hypothetical protein
VSPLAHINNSLKKLGTETLMDLEIRDPFKGGIEKVGAAVVALTLEVHAHS